MTHRDEIARLARELSQTLAMADDEGFVRLLWAINALQTGHSEAAAPLLRYLYPPEAATDEIVSPHAIHKWEIETIANELLATPKHLLYRIVDYSNYNTMVEATNLLRRIENEESGLDERIPIRRELYRIIGRQFEWQRGFFNMPQFYRNAFIYGQGDCAEYFLQRHGLTVSDLTLVGFCLFTQLTEQFGFRRETDLSSLGINAGIRERALRLLSLPIAEARRLATCERASWDLIAYRPSIFREYPCLAFGPRNARLCSPLPQLIPQRVTSGLFYDVADGGRPIREDYGRRFQSYCERYLQSMLPELGSMGEWSYRFNKNRWDTPDILIPAENTDELEIVIECKASRMSFEARFANEAVLARGYNDMVRGVFQLWRFFSHSRRGNVGRSLAPTAIGLLLTLDDWLVMGKPLQDEIVERATAMANDRDREIIEVDRRPVVFCPITDLERCLVTATNASFRAALVRATQEERLGWMLSSVHEEVAAPSAPRRKYPFDDLDKILPWWGMWQSQDDEHENFAVG